MTDVLDQAIAQLTESQAEAVNWDEGSLFVLAGPGSGKTRVLTTRVARILAQSPEQSFRVLLSLIHISEPTRQEASRMPSSA